MPTRAAGRAQCVRQLVADENGDRDRCTARSPPPQHAEWRTTSARPSRSADRQARAGGGTQDAAGAGPEVRRRRPGQATLQVHQFRAFVARIVDGRSPASCGASGSGRRASAQRGDVARLQVEQASTPAAAHGPASARGSPRAGRRVDRHDRADSVVSPLAGSRQLSTVPRVHRRPLAERMNQGCLPDGALPFNQPSPARGTAVAVGAAIAGRSASVSARALIIRLPMDLSFARTDQAPVASATSRSPCRSRAAPARLRRAML